ncbi:hypothetical protein JYU04_04585, partial [Dehalococcoides mccartyi]|nr:hypothetical protein [Dehalococcoides mccartyi]
MSLYSRFMDYVWQPVWLPSVPIAQGRADAIRNILMVVARVSFLASAMAMFDFIPAVKSLQTLLSKLSLQIIGGEVFTIDLFVFSGAAVFIALLLPAIRKTDRLRTTRFTVIAISLLMVATFTSIIVGSLSGHGDLFSENRMYVYGMSAMLLPVALPSIAIVRRLVLIFVAMTALSLIINPAYYSAILSGSTVSFFNVESALAVGTVMALGSAFDLRIGMRVRALLVVASALLFMGIIYDGS